MSQGFMVLYILIDFSPLQAARGSGVDPALEAERRVQLAAGFRDNPEARPSRQSAHHPELLVRANTHIQAHTTRVIISVMQLIHYR